MSSAADEQALLDVVVAACLEDSMPPGIDEAILDSLVTEGAGTLSRFCAWENGCLLVQPVLPADLAQLRARLVGHCTTGVLADDNVFGTLLFRIVDQATDEWRSKKSKKAHPAAATGLAAGGAGAAAAPAPADTEDEAERKRCATAYDDLLNLQGHAVDLPERAIFVSTARTSVVTFGYPSELPSVGQTRTWGMAGSNKRKYRLGGGADYATLETGERAPELITGMPSAYAATKVLLYGLAAALTVRINDTAYGGRDVGWILPPGQAKQVRVMVSLHAIHRLQWALIGILTHNAPIFIYTCDSIMVAFLTEFAKLKLHPDEIISTFIEAKPHLFIARGSADTASVSSHGETSETLEPGGQAPAAKGKMGICPLVFHGNGCTDTRCIYEHPKGGQRAAGSARQRDRPRGGNKWGGGFHCVE